MKHKLDENANLPISQVTQPSLQPISKTRAPVNNAGESKARRGSLTKGRLE
jgi:hypothetical protein